MKYAFWSKGLALATLGLSALATSPARAEVITNVIVPNDFFETVPCANNGEGERIAFSGNLHILAISTSDGAGGVHLEIQFQMQNMSGVGLTTGDKYQATGMTKGQIIDHIANAGEVYTFVNSFGIIGQGSGNNLMVHELVHVVQNANGTEVVKVDGFTITCK